MRTVEVFDDPRSLANAAAARIVRVAARVVAERGRFTLVLSGGSTPRSVFSLLASDHVIAFPWRQTEFFWGDERHVPPDHAESNFKMAWDAMLSHVPVPPENIHRIPAERSGAEDAASAYGDEIQRAFSGREGIPVFDLVLLGLGPDGHTASLFPGTAALQERERLVVANWVPKFNAQRITMTYPLLNRAAEICFLVQGEDKAEALRDVLEGLFQPDRLPAQGIRPENGSTVWLVDQAAARLCSPGQR